MIPSSCVAAAAPCRLGSPAWQLLPELHRRRDDTFITSKRTYDAFYGTELLEVCWGCWEALISGCVGG